MYRSREQWKPTDGRTVVTLHATVDGVSQWTVLLTRYIYRLQFPLQPLFLLGSALFFPSRAEKRSRKKRASSGRPTVSSHRQSPGGPDHKNPERLFGLTVWVAPVVISGSNVCAVISPLLHFFLQSVPLCTP